MAKLLIETAEPPRGFWIVPIQRAQEPPQRPRQPGRVLTITEGAAFISKVILEQVEAPLRRRETERG